MGAPAASEAEIAGPRIFPDDASEGRSVLKTAPHFL